MQSLPEPLQAGIRRKSDALARRPAGPASVKQIARVGAFLVLALVGSVLSGCASAPRREFKAADYEAVPGRAQRGVATWYGEAYRGRRTASGEKFNPDDFTAAHRTLRFGTLVEVRNLRNNRTVLVEITDRGPFGKNRIIDLSEAAARQLGMLANGTVPVEIRLMRKRRARARTR